MKNLPSKTVAQKLLIKKGYTVTFIDEPDGYVESLGDLPPDVKVISDPSEPVDLLQVFMTSSARLEEKLLYVKGLIRGEGLLWITYPKKTSALAKEQIVDINRDSIRKFAETIGLKAVAMFSVDKDWSAFRFKIV